jgi:hypothetical protein
MMRAASTIFSHVLPMFRTWMPAGERRTERGWEKRVWAQLTVNAALPDVGEHLLVAVLGADVALRREEHLDVLLGRGEDGREF